ncbi:MAG: hypothetical protein PSV17_08560 [Methylotenera sp.]|uniref:ArnT family glycosyltransferase n=1 Tax=Methylotenera sp. TaxID=2051956 RepID=UPI002488D536|nr:hypothetical protein [Methylotenera sp.]MDI1309469.1 hypothetical protein [Methylotenera sp.]
MHEFTYKKLSYALFAGLAIFILMTFKQYGISNDENVQHVYGQLLLKFYNSGLVDQSAFSYKNLYLYGGFFDLTAAILEKILPMWVWDIRHLLSAIFGFFGIVAVYKITKELAGERAAFLAILLLSLTGAWSGAMFTHTKDVTFGACMIWALYYTMLISKQLPRVPVLLSIKLGVAIGLALGLRIGGAFAVIYLGLLVIAAALLQTSSLKQKLVFCFKSAYGLIPAGITAFCLMILFWPWVIMGKNNILIAAKSFSHFAFNMQTIVDGRFMSIGDVPRTYLLEYLSIRLPEVFLLGVLSAIILISMKLKYIELNKKLGELSLAIAILFPLLFIIFDRPALYNGVRHFTFIIPPLAVMAGIGLSRTWDILAEYAKLQKAFGLLVIVLSLSTALTLFELRPYEYIYYNHFAAGSIKEAEHNWEGDYWSSSIIEASKMLEAYIDVEQSNNKIHDGSYSVALCAETFQGDAYLDHRFKITENWVKADFFISSTNMNCDKVLQGKIVGKVERLGATLAVIKDRRALRGKDRRPTPAPKN